MIALNERTVRSQARVGVRLTKSRKGKSLDNHGGYMLVDAERNVLLAGARYDLTLADVVAWLRRPGKETRAMIAALYARKEHRPRVQG